MGKMSDGLGVISYKGKINVVDVSGKMDVKYFINVLDLVLLPTVLSVYLEKTGNYSKIMP